MPCNDVTERIRVVIDDEDRLKDYRFIKQTCGQAVGLTDLLIGELADCSVDKIIAIDPTVYAKEHLFDEPLEEFLSLKHLIAVQSALEVLVGKSSGGPDEICASAEISFDNGETVLDARIIVDLVTKKIKSCGNCGTCSGPK